MGLNGASYGLRRVLGATPLAFAVVVLGGLLLTLGSLLGLGHPDIGYFRSNTHDALALLDGQGIFRDPDHGYTGLLYTPGLPAVLALLNGAHRWDGWAPLVSILSVLSIVGVAATLARPATAPGASAGRRAWSWLVAIGMGAFALWLISSLKQADLLFAGAADEFAWACAFGGLVLGARFASSAPRAVAAVALLTAAAWIKQPAIVASVAMAVWAVALAARGRVRWRPLVAFLGTLVAVNVLLLAIVNVATHGWEYFFTVDLPQNHARIYGVRTVVEAAFEGLAFSALVAAAMWAAARFARRGSPDTARRPAGLPSLLVVLVAVALPAALLFRAKQGGEDNQYIGLAWAMGLLAVLGWRRARDDAGAALWTDAIVAAVLAVAVAGTLADRDRFTLRGFRAHFVEVPAFLRAYGAAGSVYHPLFSDVSYAREHRVWQDVPNLADLLAGGRQPRELVRALLDRRFDAVFAFGGTLGDATLARQDRYASAYGRREDGYFWKLDRVIAARYVAPGAGAPPGALVRRPGPELDPWMRSCFGPFGVAGARWAIRAGGGFWCHPPGSQRLELRGTPAPAAEVVTTGPVAPAGALRVLPRAPARAFSVALDGHWRLNARRAGRAWDLQLLSPAGAARASAPATAPLVLRFAPGARATLATAGSVVTVLAPRQGRGQVSLFGPPAGVAFDLSGLRLKA